MKLDIEIRKRMRILENAKGTELQRLHAVAFLSLASNNLKALG